MENNEAMYQLTMKLIKDLVKSNVFTKEEYEELKAKFIEKYRPRFHILT